MAMTVRNRERRVSRSICTLAPDFQVPSNTHNAHAPHSIISSAVANTDGGTVRSSILAVCASMISSNLVGCRTGSSADFAPLRIRPVQGVARGQLD
jgi:hypothetical protein